jgi:hypothetical protein
MNRLCRGGQIRTDDLLVPNQARYRATLHPEKHHFEAVHPQKDCKYSRNIHSCKEESLTQRNYSPKRKTTPTTIPRQPPLTSQHYQFQFHHARTLHDPVTFPSSLSSPFVTSSPSSFVTFVLRPRRFPRPSSRNHSRSSHPNHIIRPKVVD